MHLRFSSIAALVLIGALLIAGCAELALPAVADLASPTRTLNTASVPAPEPEPETTSVLVMVPTPRTASRRRRRGAGSSPGFKRAFDRARVQHSQVLPDAIREAHTVALGPEVATVFPDLCDILPRSVARSMARPLSGSWSWGSWLRDGTLIFYPRWPVESTWRSTVR